MVRFTNALISALLAFEGANALPVANSAHVQAGSHEIRENNHPGPIGTYVDYKRDEANAPETRSNNHPGPIGTYVDYK